MFRDFDSLIKSVKGNREKKTIAVAAAHDQEVLACAAEARRLEIADFILVGSRDKISEILSSLGETPGNWHIIDQPHDTKAAALAVELVRKGSAHLPMKGLVHTSVFLKAVLDKEQGLVGGKAVLSQITVAEYKQQNRLILVTDCAINIAPDFAAKVKIAENAVTLARAFGINKPKVAAIAPVEVVNPAIPETVDAAMLSKAAERGQIKNCIIDGPLALDNAVSEEAARVKGIVSPVAGSADILLMPNLAAGNAQDKSLRYFSGFKTGSAVLGAKTPIIVTSRSDSAENKLHAVVLGIICDIN